MKTLNMDVLKLASPDLLDVFIETTRRRLGALELAVMLDDFEEAIRIAHGIKTGARTLGAERIGEVCQAIEEDLARVGPRRNAKLLLEGLQREFTIFRNVLSQIPEPLWS